MKGVFPDAFVRAPHKWSLTDSYAQMDRFTYEEFLPEQLSYVSVLLPPLQFEGVRLKGLFFSPGVDAVRQMVPSVADRFISISNSRWASYPWSEHADGYFVCYDNAARMAYFRDVYPGRRHVKLIPNQTADFTNEESFRRRPGIEKDIDILVVARSHVMKDLPFLAKGILALRRKNPAKRYRVVWADPGRNSSSARHPHALKMLSEMETCLGKLEDYLELIGRVESAAMPGLYARAKAFVLTSTVEGKNRALQEALCADVPVVVGDDYNSAARGGQSILPTNAGLTVPRDPEGLAEGLERVVRNYGDFEPRANYLKTGGRLAFFWNCVLSFDHFHDQIPGHTIEERGRWLDAAMSSIYGVTMKEFIYNSNPRGAAARQGRRSLSRARGKADIKQLLESTYASCLD